MTLERLVNLVQYGADASVWQKVNEEVFTGLFGSNGGRYRSEAQKDFQLRAPPKDDDGVPFAAYIHQQNQPSGAYGGTSLAIFPVPDHPCLVTLVVGTGGLSPDERILGRPGHARKVEAICSWLNKEHGKGMPVAWAKADPTQIDLDAPDEVKRRFTDYDKVFKKYGRVLYAVFLSKDAGAIRDAVSAFLDLLLLERGHDPLTPHQADSSRIISAWMRQLTPGVDESGVATLLEQQRFVIIQGPPGTGKTRLAGRILTNQYAGHGRSIQFHPNTTYEDFVGGLAPESGQGEFGFRFAPKRGHLMDAVAAARQSDKSYLLHIDEINRADLGKVLGEAIYLFEPHADDTRSIKLPHSFPDIGNELELPNNLHVLGTMNTADRSLAIVDVAVRRRFAFVSMWPQAGVVQDKSKEFMQTAFQQLQTIFIDHASEDSFNLMPGHSYFLEQDGIEPSRQLQTTLAPLLHEYLAQGYVGGFAEEIRTYLQWLEASQVS